LICKAGNGNPIIDFREWLFRQIWTIFYYQVFPLTCVNLIKCFSDVEGIVMKSSNTALIAAIVAGAALASATSAQAWWGPGYNRGWGNDRWGNDYWGDGLGDLWGDGDFSIGFSGRTRGHGYGRGYGRGYGDYYGD
jgi:hypothetical protein